MSIHLFLCYNLVRIGGYMKKNGFTLVELLAVIVLLALLMTIAVPSAFKLSSKVKNKAYLTKIDLIEQAANNYGQSNISLIKKGTSIEDPNIHLLCTFEYKDEQISQVTYEKIKYDETRLLINDPDIKQYWCTEVTVDHLVGTNNLDWDEKNQCGDKCTSDNKEYYDNVVLNPTTRFIINKCNIYIYYRNNRIYSHFDIDTCNFGLDTPETGHEYRPLMG